MPDVFAELLPQPFLAFDCLACPNLYERPSTKLLFKEKKSFPSNEIEYDEKS